MGHVACMGEQTDTQRVIWWVKAVGERPLKRPKYRLEDNIKTDLREIGLSLIQNTN
jgi:hypothetical protein